MIIYNLLQKGKFIALLHLGFLLACLILGSGAVYGIFKLYSIQKARAPVSVEYPPEYLLKNNVTKASSTRSSIDTVSEKSEKSVSPGSASKTFVAARTGKSYYYPWCTGAKRIAEKNKVWFATQAEAEKAGYTASKSCKGLK